MHEGEDAAVESVEGPVTTARLRDSVLFREIGSLESEVRVKVLKDGKVSGRFTGVFVFRSPGSMRLRLYDPFGATVMDMVKAGSRMQIYLPMNSTIYEGWTPPLGPPPDALFGMEEGKAFYTLYVFRPGAENGGKGVMDLAAKHSFHRRTLLTNLVLLYNNGRKFMRMALREYSADRVPGRIEISFYNGFLLSMSLKEPLVNAEVSPEAFWPMARKGRRTLPLQTLLRNPPEW
jgi:hypothetical protein